MNWLAHLRLSPPSPLLRLGNLCGDFVTGVDLASLHPDLQRGIALHRAIDRFVDAHPVVLAARRRLGPSQRRFAGVLVDVFFDHFLARDWDRHGDGGALASFVARVHDDLCVHAGLLPPRLHAAVPRLRADGWLASYASVDGIAQVLGLMARRLSRPSPLAEGADALRRHYAGLGDDFAALWPELTRFAVATAPVGTCGATTPQPAESRAG